MHCNDGCRKHTPIQLSVPKVINVSWESNRTWGKYDFYKPIITFLRSYISPGLNSHLLDYQSNPEQCHTVMWYIPGGQGYCSRVNCLIIFFPWIPGNFRRLQSRSTNFSIYLYLSVSSLWHRKQTIQNVSPFTKGNLQSARHLTVSPLWLKNPHRSITKF